MLETVKQSRAASSVVRNLHKRVKHYFFERHIHVSVYFLEQNRFGVKRGEEYRPTLYIMYIIHLYICSIFVRIFCVRRRIDFVELQWDDLFLRLNLIFIFIQSKLFMISSWVFSLQCILKDSRNHSISDQFRVYFPINQSFSGLSVIFLMQFFADRKFFRLTAAVWKWQTSFVASSGQSGTRSLRKLLPAIRHGRNGPVCAESESFEETVKRAKTTLWTQTT